MTIEEVANRLVELMRTGQSEQAYRELFASNASAHEMPGVPEADTHGIDNLLAKNEAWGKGVKEVHELEVTDPLIYNEFFTVGMGIDLTKADGSRTHEHELCVYHVRGGKIQSERFIYAMG